MKKLIITLIFVSILLVSCFEGKTPQVVYDDSVSDVLTIENVLEDTTKVLVAGMPVYLDSTNMLIHPIGWDNIYVDKTDRYGISGSVDINIKSPREKMMESTSSFGVDSNNKDYIYGSMVNLIFEDLENGTQKILTDKVMVIKRVAYLKDLAKDINKHYLFYTVHDKDYNRDGQLDYQDMSAFYMSNLDGNNFTKITQDYHFFDTSKLLFQNGKYYFRTIEDVNKDGEFNKKDKFHYYYIDLKNGNLNPVEYFPLELMNIK